MSRGRNGLSSHKSRLASGLCLGVRGEVCAKSPVRHPVGSKYNSVHLYVVLPRADEISALGSPILKIAALRWRRELFNPLAKPIDLLLELPDFLLQPCHGF